MKTFDCLDCVRRGLYPMVHISDPSTKYCGPILIHYDNDNQKHYHDPTETRGKWQCGNGHYGSYMLSRVSCNVPGCHHIGYYHRELEGYEEPETIVVEKPIVTTDEPNEPTVLNYVTLSAVKITINHATAVTTISWDGATINIKTL